MLEIRITPKKMFNVLSLYLDDNQAKSIILDLLMEMDGQSLVEVETSEEAEGAEAPADGEDTGEAPAAVAKTSKPKAVKRGRSSRRVNFGLFGGAMDPLGDLPDSAAERDDEPEVEAATDEA